MSYYDDFVDLVTDIRIQALSDSASNPNDDFHNFLFYVFRWYSKTFFTPLHVVEELPLESVLRAFFYDKADHLTPEERHEELLLVLESPEQRSARFMKESEDLVGDEALLAEIDAKPESEVDRKGLNVLPVSIIKPDLASLSPDIKMTFISEEEAEELENGVI